LSQTRAVISQLIFSLLVPRVGDIVRLLRRENYAVKRNLDKQQVSNSV